MLNLYGGQRFVDPEAIVQARHLLQRGSMRGRKSKFVVSVAQAAVFNDYLQRRGWRAEPLTGEWYGTEGGGRFEGNREDPKALKERLNDGEICPLGPLPGRDIQPEGRCGELLAESLASLNLDDVPWNEFGKRLRGSWRPLWVQLPELTATEADGAVVLQFTLASGSYATVLVQRLLEDTWIFPRSH